MPGLAVLADIPRATIRDEWADGSTQRAKLKALQPPSGNRRWTELSTQERWIAVFGDTHGHLRLMFQLCRLWQRETGRLLDGILQCGDLGFFPQSGRLDDATAQLALENPEELGFARFFKWPEPQEDDSRLQQWLFGPADPLDTVAVPAVWCHGNHEDFEELELAVGGANCIAVDAFQRLMYLRSGFTTSVAGVNVGAIGGGVERTEGGSSRRRSDPGNKHPWATVDRKACDRLSESGNQIDVLISHVAPRADHGDARFGSNSARRANEGSQPLYHFFAHHRKPVPLFAIGQCSCVWLNDVGFKHQGTGVYGNLKPGCMGILRWQSRTGHEFEIVSEPWFRDVHAGTWYDL